MPTEAYYAEVTTYANNYIWKKDDFSPSRDAKLWEMMSGRAAEYFQAVKIRGNAISTGKELKSNYLIGKRERSYYSALDHMHRLEIIEAAAWETKGIFIEWGEV